MSDLGRFYNFHRFSSGVVRCSQWCSFRGGTSGAPCWGFPVPSVPLPSYLRVLMHVGMVPVGRQSTDAFFYAPDCLSTFPSSSGRVWMHPGRGSLCTTLWWSSSMVRVCSRAACTFGVPQQVSVSFPTCSLPTLSLWSVARQCIRIRSNKVSCTSWTRHSWVLHTFAAA